MRSTRSGNIAAKVFPSCVPYDIPCKWSAHGKLLYSLTYPNIAAYHLLGAHQRSSACHETRKRWSRIYQYLPEPLHSDRLGSHWLPNLSVMSVCGARKFGWPTPCVELFFQIAFWQYISACGSTTGVIRIPRFAIKWNVVACASV